MHFFAQKKDTGMLSLCVICPFRRRTLIRSNETSAFIRIFEPV